MALSLTINSTPATLASIGVGEIVIHRQILAPDTAEIELVPAARPDAQPLKFGDVVQILDDSTVVFIGTVTKTPRPKLNANLERRSYLLSNVLWSLARQPYQQTWNRDATTTYYKGRVNLGRNLDDSKQNIGEAIADILDHAAALGIDVAYDSDDLAALTTYFPDEEALDVMHIEAITRILRWTPSVTVRVEYATGTPTLRFVPHADETPVSTPYATFRQLEISPLDEQKISGVVLNFETTNTDNDLIYTDVTQQTAGTTTGTDVLRQTIQLEGYVASEQFQEAKVVVDTTWSLSDASFWTDRIIGLQGVTSLVITPEASPPDYSAHPYILMQGPVPEWTGKTVQEYTFNATATFSFGGETFADVPIAVRVALTDANTKTYRQTVSSYFRDGETAPSGLAASILAQFANQQWEGSASIHLNPASFGYSPGQVLAIAAPTGYKWEETGALIPSASSLDGTSTISPRIESCVYSIPASGVGTAALQITFGPPRHLGARDIVNLYQATRKRIPTQWSRSEPLGSSSTASSFNAGGPVPSSTGGMLSMTPGSSVGSLPTTPTHNGHLLYSYEGAPSWLSVPPADETGLLWWDYRYGPAWVTHATGGYPFVSKNGVAFEAKIPVADIYSYNDPAAGTVANCVMLPKGPAIEWKKIESGALNATNPATAGYYLAAAANGLFTWTQFPTIPTIPEAEDELPTTPTHDGHLLYSYEGAPSWLSVPPADETGLLWWDYRYGPAWVTHATGGYPFVSKNGVAFEAKIPVADIYSYNDPAAGTVANCVMLPKGPAIEWKKIESGALNATNPATAGYYLAAAANGLFTWTQFPTIPEAEDELPTTPTHDGHLLYSYEGAPSWLSVPPADETGLLWWDYRYGPAWVTHATGGYPFVYKNGVAFDTKIPVADIYSYNDPAAGTVANCVMLPKGPAIEWKKIESGALNATNPATAGYYLAAAANGLFTWTQFPTIPEAEDELPTTPTHDGHLLYSYEGAPSWLSVPPADETGLLWWDYRYGPAWVTHATGGYPFVSKNGVAFEAKIPVADIYSYNDPAAGTVANCVMLPKGPAIEWKKIESGALNATNPATAGYYLAAAANGLFTWTQFPTIPEAEDELPTTPTHDGHLLYSYEGAPSWLSVPPADETGLLWWDYRYGPAWVTHATGGYPFVYKNGIAFAAKIPANKLSIAGDAGYYILHVDTSGIVSEIAIENLTKNAFVGTGSGHYVLSFDLNGQNPALYEIGAGYV